MIDLTKLQAFVQVAEVLNFSEAAKRLNLSQPTISHHIKALELDLGVELFDRSKTRLALTDAGRVLQPWARKLLRSSNEVREMMTSLDQQVVGELRIACSTTSGKYILPKLAARFRQRFPGISVSILACTAPHVIPRLLEGEANLGVLSYETVDSSMDVTEFFDDAIILIVPEDHPWVHFSHIDPDDLLDEPLIIREPTSGTRKVMLAQLSKFDITLEDLNIFLELGNAEAIVETVAAGYGVAFVSRLAAAYPLKLGSVVEVPVNGLTLKRKIYMVRNKIENPNHHPQEVFWSFVHDPDNQDLLNLAKVVEE
ncbi:MAG: LysR family transcriptional regulator [Anaerolineales bacterium]|nr:LysR family transcriptional regulator [Anaerolineales bacterium]